MARTRSAPPRRMWTSLAPGLALLAGLGLFLLAVIEIGEFTRRQIRAWDRYSLAFVEIDCPSPPLQKREDFLLEVQSRSSLPERLQLLDQDLPARLADAFAGHPYVEKVEKVAVQAGRKVQIHLSYRIPVLEVMLADRRQGLQPTQGKSRQASIDDSGGDLSWFVDAKGTLLPRKKLREPLPLLLVTTAPAGQAGRPWGVANVEAAALTAAFLHEQRHRLNLGVFELKGTEMVLSTPAGTKVLWGHAPGQESSGEATASAKLDRLLSYCAIEGSLDKPRGRREHNLRATDGP
jgi:hypothetical protein